MMVRGAAGASLLLLTGVLSVAVAAPLDKKNGGERSAEPSAKEAVKENPDCFDELENGTNAVFACRYPVALAEQERKDLKRITREYLQDVTCSVNVRINRGMVDRAVQDTDYVFQSPEQPVTCDVKTHKSVMRITATFAPKVTFKDGKAVSGSPGLDNIKGVTRVLSWPVKKYVNWSPHIRETMVLIINAYRKYWAEKHASR